MHTHQPWPGLVANSEWGGGHAAQGSCLRATARGRLSPRHRRAVDFSGKQSRGFLKQLVVCLQLLQTVFECADTLLGI